MRCLATRLGAALRSRTNSTSFSPTRNAASHNPQTRNRFNTTETDCESCWQAHDTVTRPSTSSRPDATALWLPRCRSGIDGEEYEGRQKDQMHSALQRRCAPSDNGEHADDDGK